MGVLLDTVTLEDWKAVVSCTLAKAKEGCAASRAWLAQYLVGMPKTKAPTPVHVVVQQWNGENEVSKRLADRLSYPFRDESKDAVMAAIMAELVEKTEKIETAETPATARDSGENA